MPKKSIAPSIDAIIEDAVAGVVQRAVESIRIAIAAQVAAELKAAPPPGRAAAGAPRRGRKPRRTARREISRWVADNRARRVPNFVIEATGLETKKKIVAKYGANAAFELGKPLPAIRPIGAQQSGEGAKAKAQAPVRARPPVIRKKAAAAAK